MEAAAIMAEPAAKTAFNSGGGGGGSIIRAPHGSLV